MSTNPGQPATRDAADDGRDDTGSSGGAPGQDGSVRWGSAPLRSAWPAYLCAAALLLYSVEKGYYAIQGRIGIPGGRHVPDSAYQELHHVALRQWTLSTLGFAGAMLALATVTAAGRHIPRALMLTALWGALLPMAAGAPYVLHDIMNSDDALGRKLLSGVRPIAQIGVWVAMTWSYQTRSRVLRRRGNSGR
jgi:hypothetical protein